MTGLGSSGGAATVVNAMATGMGAAFGLRLAVKATAESSSRPRVVSNGRPIAPDESRLVTVCVELAAAESGSSEALSVTIESEIPQQKGLKSSSAVALAVIEAATRHWGRELTDQRLMELAAEAGIRSRTSRTGAFDDAAACRLGGLVFTDNTKRKIVSTSRLPEGLVALVHIPEGARASGDFQETDLGALEEPARRAFDMAMSGKVREAMLANTVTYAQAFGTDYAFTRAALDAGAWAAGLSGTGPAEVALVAKEDQSRFESLRGPVRVVSLNHGVAA